MFIIPEDAIFTLCEQEINEFVFSDDEDDDGDDESDDENDETN